MVNRNEIQHLRSTLTGEQSYSQRCVQSWNSKVTNAKHMNVKTEEEQHLLNMEIQEHINAMTEDEQHMLNLEIQEHMNAMTEDEQHMLNMEI